MQNALLNVPAHDFDQLVTERRSNVVNEVRDNNRSNRRDHYEEEESPRRSYESEPAYNESEPSYRESEPAREPDYSQKPEGVPEYTPEPVYNQPAPEPIREPEPVYHEPEPVYEPPPEPVYNEPAPVVDDAPTPGDELSKGRN